MRLRALAILTPTPANADGRPPSELELHVDNWFHKWQIGQRRRAVHCMRYLYHHNEFLICRERPDLPRRYNTEADAVIFSTRLYYMTYYIPLPSFLFATSQKAPVPYILARTFQLWRHFRHDLFLRYTCVGLAIPSFLACRFMICMNTRARNAGQFLGMML